MASPVSAEVILSEDPQPHFRPIVPPAIGQTSATVNDGLSHAATGAVGWSSANTRREVLQPTRMTRSRLYVLIDSFENDMRNVLTRFILEYLSESEALGPSFEKANDRRLQDDPTGTSSIGSYLDMQEVYDILNRHRELLPEELGTELRKNTQLLAQLVQIRNRVMHGRPLREGDPENAVSACTAFATRYWSAVREAVDHLLADPTWEPAFEQQVRHTDRILHNLPLPEYDETGLIGRSADCKRVASYLLRRREPIVTITGEGGIGKTAVALEVAYSILDDPSSPYECILWVSLKTERLAGSGIVSIADAVQDITGAAKKLGQAVVDDFRGTVVDLAEMLSGIETLLIVDNLETVDGTDVRELYEILPDSVTYLFTSRIGVGQLERKVDLGPLQDRDADMLFRSFARSRGVSRLATLTPQTAREVVSRLRNSPLAIRWYIMAVQNGERPDLALSDQSVLLEFCIRSVFKALGATAKTISTILFALDRAVTFDELAILSDISLDDLRRAMHSLLSGSMVILESDRDRELVSRVRLTEAARLFLRKVETPQAAVVDRFLAREEEYRKADEHRRADEQARRLSPNTVRTRNDLDKPVAHLLRLALMASRKETTQRALEITARARELNPDYWEVDRVEAFILSGAKQTEQASAIYRGALRKADDEGRAVVAYYFSSHLARRAFELESAIEQARVAHDYFQMPETAQQLGTLLSWNQQFEESQEYLINVVEQAQGKLRLIALTSLVDSWKRWAETEYKHHRRPLEAASKAHAGLAIAAKEIRDGTYDIKLADVALDCGVMLIHATTSHGVDSARFAREHRTLLSMIAISRLLFERCVGWPRFARAVALLYRSDTVGDEVKYECAKVIELVPNDKSADRSSEVLVGTVTSWRGTYGFLAHPLYPGNVFFPAAVIEDHPRDSTVSLRGRSVRFRVGVDLDRPRAEWVQIVR